MATAIRLGTLSLGFICASLGCYGAFEFAYALEGQGDLSGLGSSSDCGFGRSYTAYRRDSLARGGTLQSHSFGGLALVPAGAVVFFSSIGAGAHGEGGRRGGTKRIPKRWLTALAKHSPRPP